MDCKDIVFVTVKFEQLKIFALEYRGFINVSNICEPLGIDLDDYRQKDEYKHASEFLLNFYGKSQEVVINDSYSEETRGTYFHPYLAKLFILTSQNMPMVKNYLFMISRLHLQAVRESTTYIEENEQLSKDIAELKKRLRQKNKSLMKLIGKMPIDRIRKIRSKNLFAKK
jgi:hypothetical protein